MQWEKEVVAIYVGCGINDGSNPAKEFMETVNKSMTVKRAL
jgi:isochorismate synthase